MKKDNLFGMVAKDELGIETLESRKSDGLDFHNIAVWQVTAAFERIWRGRDAEVRRLRKRIAALEANGCRKPPRGGLLDSITLRSCDGFNAKRRVTTITKEAGVNSYEITYQISGVGIVKEQVTAGSEQNARDLLRAKFGQRQVQIISGRMTEFGGGRDDRRDRR